MKIINFIIEEPVAVGLLVGLGIGICIVAYWEYKRIFKQSKF